VSLHHSLLLLGQPLLLILDPAVEPTLLATAGDADHAVALEKNPLGSFAADDYGVGEAESELSVDVHPEEEEAGKDRVFEFALAFEEGLGLVVEDEGIVTKEHHVRTLQPQDRDGEARLIHNDEVEVLGSPKQQVQSVQENPYVSTKQPQPT